MNRFVVLVSGITLVVVAVVGCIDAARHDHAGLALIFGILAVGVAGIAIVDGRTRGVVLRRDLASWVERTSAVTGETPDELTSRAVSRLRAGFSPGEEAR
jgi:hypothetical protein